MTMIPAAFASSLANHLWQSTVFAVLVAFLAFALRNNHARARYWIWLIASVKFLIPFSLLVVIGSHFGSSASRPVPQPELSVVVEQISQPFSKIQSPAVIAPSTPTQNSSLLPGILLALWASGSLAIVLSGLRKWRFIHVAVRQGFPLPLRAPVPVVSSPSLLEPGVFGLFRPVLLLPQGITEHLTPAHLDAILAHELCHVRHRDNLAAAVHMAVETIFWFHPLVWWLGARLVDERERACDEEVLGLGNEPEVYAESILKTCEFYFESPLVCMSGVTGSDLKKRIRRIMTQQLSAKLDLGKKLLLTTVGVAAVVGPLAFGILNAAPRQEVSQNVQPPATPARSFEVATIKPNKSGSQNVGMHFDPSGRFTGEGVNLKLLFEEAYSLKDSQIIGAPSWFGSERYNIEAKPDDSVVEEMQKVPQDQRPAIMMEMIRGLLEDRCKLTLRHETRDLPIYSMVVGKNGPNLHESVPPPDAVAPPPSPGSPDSGLNGGPRRVNRGIKMGRGELTVMAAPLDLFATVLSRQLGRPVVDNTGLKGVYDFTLKWTPDEGQDQMFKGAGGGPDGRPPADAPPPADASGPSIFTAIQEQLGLKLEAKTAPMQVTIIDHIERPSEN